MKILLPKLPSNLAQLDDAQRSFQYDESISEVLIDNEILGSLDLKQASLSESSIKSTDFTGAKIERFDVLDCEFKNCNFTATKFPSSSWHVILIDSARCSGMQVTNSSFRNVTFRGCKLELMNFRFSNLDSIVFEDCVLNDVDFNDAKLKNIEFINCTINNISFTNARMTNVDLSHSQIEDIRGANSLRGTTVSYDQLMQLGPQMAAEFGIKVK